MMRAASTDGVTLVVDPVSLDLLARLRGRLCRRSRRFVVQGHQPQCGLGLRLRVELLGLDDELVTYNLNGIRARLPRLIEYLAREKPDVVCLQELKCADDALPIARYRGGRLSRRVARAEGLQRRRDPQPQRRARASPGRPARRSRRQPQPLYRGRGGRRDRRLDLPSQRQSDRHREIRLQAELDGAAAGARGGVAGARAAGGAGRRLQRHPRGPRHFFAPGDGGRRACSSPRARRRIGGSSIRARPTRCARFTPTSRSCSPSGIIRRARWQRDAGFRIDHLLCSPASRRPLRGAEVHKWARAEEKASDHAPVAAIELGVTESWLVNPVDVVDLGAGQLGDRHHPLIILQHPAEFAVCGRHICSTHTRRMIFDQHEGQLPGQAAAVNLAARPPSAARGPGGCAGCAGATAI